MVSDAKRRGFTLVETIISIALSSLIFVSASGVMAIMFSSNNRTRQVQTIEQTKNDLHLDISNAIRWADKVEILGNQLLVTQVDGAQNRYTYNSTDGNVMKDTQVLGQESVRVTSFEIFDRSYDVTAVKPKSLEIVIGLEHREFPVLKDSLRIIVSQRLAEISH